MPTEVETNLHVGDIRFIVADAAPEGYIFDQWTGDIAALDDSLSSATFVTMPAADVTVTATYLQLPPALRLIWNDIENVPVDDATSLDDWNTFFNLYNIAYGDPFTIINVVGNEVRLSGSNNVVIKDNLFVGSFSPYLLKVIDEASCVIRIEYSAFSNTFALQTCVNLDTAIFPSCTYVEEFAFDSCTSLVTTNFDSLDETEDYVFYNCTGLLGFSAPIATAFGRYCFSNCTSIITVTAPDLVIADDYCFSYTISATHYDFPVLTDAGNGCFRMMYDTSLITINLPTVLNVGDACFYGCALLQTVYLPNCINFGTDPSVDSSMFTYLEHGLQWVADLVDFFGNVNAGLLAVPGSSFNYTTGRFTTPNNFCTVTVSSSQLTADAGKVNRNLTQLLYHNAYGFYNPDAPSYPSIPDWSGLPTPANIVLECGYNVTIVTELGTFVPEVPFEAYYLYTP